MKWQLSLEQVLSATGGQVLNKATMQFSGVGTDSRQDLSARLFIALKGDSFDAHDFLKAAVEQKAAGLLVHRDVQLTPELKKATVIRVADTLIALQQLGLFWRRLNKFKVIGITGSNGKTTTKMFTHTLLKEQWRTFAAEGSLNNHWGVPMSLLQAQPGTQMLVQEMGMNHLGEITALCKICEPDIVGVTMVGQAHIGELGSQANVAKAKEEIYRASPKAMAIFNRDNPFTQGMWNRRNQWMSIDNSFTFSETHPDADVHLRCVSAGLEGLTVEGHLFGQHGRAQIPVIGEQNLVNLMAAACFAGAAGVKADVLWNYLPRCHTGWGRNQLLTLKSGARVLFDAYNANPESMAALMQNLGKLKVKGRKVVVLGEMLELGAEAAQAHRRVGELVAQVTPDEVWFWGPHRADFVAGLESGGFRKKPLISIDYEENLARQIGSMLSAGDIAVIKGSRGMKMERVLQSWGPLEELSKR